MPGKTLLIVNPAARHGTTASLVPAVEKLLENVPHETLITGRMGDAAEFARTAKGCDAVVAVGGDGTVHEVLNGLMEHPPESRPALGLLPTGSGNDTRRTLGVPLELTDAARALVVGERRRFDVGRCNGVYFNNSFAAGLDAKVTAKAVEYKVTKHRDGLWLYLTALMHVLLHDLSSFPLEITFDDDDPAMLDSLIIAITNGPTYGGGFRIAPDAVPDDGLFEICRIDPLSLPQALLRLPFLVFGRHTRMKPVHMSRHARIAIASAEPVPAQIDGELLCERRYQIEILPRAIECIVPKAAR